MRMRLRKMLKFYIAASDYHQRDIANQIGIHPSTLTRFLSGKSLNQEATINIINWIFGDE